MSVGLVIEIESRPLPRVEADLAAAGFFADDRPLRGIAGMADWRLCGLISELLEQGRLRGELGEAILIPSGGRLRAPRVLLLGLGERRDFLLQQPSQVKSFTADAVRRAGQLGVRTLALAPPGVAPYDFPRHAPALLEGVLEAVREASAGLRLRLLTPETEVGRAARALAAAVPKDHTGVSIELVPPGSLSEPSHPAGPELHSYFPGSSSSPHRY